MSNSLGVARWVRSPVWIRKSGRCGSALILATASSKRGGHDLLVRVLAEPDVAVADLDEREAACALPARRPGRMPATRGPRRRPTRRGPCPPRPCISRTRDGPRRRIVESNRSENQSLLPFRLECWRSTLSGGIREAAGAVRVRRSRALRAALVECLAAHNVKRPSPSIPHRGGRNRDLTIKYTRNVASDVSGAGTATRRRHSPNWRTSA